MKKVIFTLFVLLCVYALNLQAQMPQYYNLNTGTGSNTFPFGQVAGKAVNILFLAGDFVNPTPIPTGKQITAVYFRTSTAGTRVFTNLHILLAQDTITALTSATYYSGTFDTVFVKDTSLTSTVDGWMKVQLRHPFVYNPAKSLILFVGQCSNTGTGVYVRTSSLTPAVRRVNSVGGCPFVANGLDGAILNFGVDVESASPVYQVPDLLYYKFKNNPTATTTPNFAIPGVGSNPVTLTTLTLASGGQFDSCLSGVATTSAKIMTGYNLSTGTSSFTISMWLNNLPTPATTRYLFGDMGYSFRCFVGGVAPTNGAVLRGTGVTDVPINNIFPGPSVVHIVYDSAISSVKIYKNGILDNTVPQTAFNFTAGTGFSVGGYSSSAGLEGLMDEFRFYKRALSDAEILGTWNLDLGSIVSSIHHINSEIPKSYNLSQNYPNPFNPVTKISFDIPKNGLVTLKIYDVLGKEVKSLVNEVKSAGKYIVDFDGTSFSSGTYFYRLESNGFVSTKKMLLIK
jgi:hypothetical protein